MLAVIVSEIMIQLFVEINYNFSDFDADFHHTFRKNMTGLKYSDSRVSEVVTNSRGFRGKEYSYNKKERNRIMLLGDSIVASVDMRVNETYSALLEEMLNKELEENKSNSWEVISVGVESWDTYLSFNYFLKEGHKYNPDIVILEFTTGNDFLGILDSDFPDFNNTVIIVDKFKQPSSSYRTRLWLNQHSGLYRLAQNFYHNYIKEKGSEGFFSKGYDETFYRAFGKLKVLFSAFDKVANEKNITFIVQVNTDLRQNNVEHYNHWQKKRGDFIPFEQLMHPTKIIIDFLNSTGIEYVDDSQVIFEADDYVSFEDGHLSGKGSRKVAELLYDKIQEVAGEEDTFQLKK